MATALSIFGVAFAAFCVWLAVRIINRRERWAKRTLAGVVGVPLLYVVSFGPACWAYSRTHPHREWAALDFIYEPILRIWYDHDGIIADTIQSYANVGSDVPLHFAIETTPVKGRLHVMGTFVDDP
jgi:hypothetical protein